MRFGMRFWGRRGGEALLHRTPRVWLRWRRLGRVTTVSHGDPQSDGGAGGREDGAALASLPGRAPLPLTHGAGMAVGLRGRAGCGFLCARGEGRGPFGFLLLGAPRGPQSLPTGP